MTMFSTQRRLLLDTSATREAFSDLIFPVTSVTICPTAGGLQCVRAGRGAESLIAMTESLLDEKVRLEVARILMDRSTMTHLFEIVYLKNYSSPNRRRVSSDIKVSAELVSRRVREALAQSGAATGSGPFASVTDVISDLFIAAFGSLTMIAEPSGHLRGLYLDTLVPSGVDLRNFATRHEIKAVLSDIPEMGHAAKTMDAEILIEAYAPQLMQLGRRLKLIGTFEEYMDDSISLLSRYLRFAEDKDNDVPKRIREHAVFQDLLMNYNMFLAACAAPPSDLMTDARTMEVEGLAITSEVLNSGLLKTVPVSDFASMIQAELVADESGRVGGIILAPKIADVSSVQIMDLTASVIPGFPSHQIHDPKASSLFGELLDGLKKGLAPDNICRTAVFYEQLRIKSVVGESDTSVQLIEIAMPDDLLNLAAIALSNGLLVQSSPDDVEAPLTYLYNFPIPQDGRRMPRLSAWQGIAYTSDPGVVLYSKGTREASKPWIVPARSMEASSFGELLDASSFRWGNYSEGRMRITVTINDAPVAIESNTYDKAFGLRRYLRRQMLDLSNTADWVTPALDYMIAMYEQLPSISSGTASRRVSLGLHWNTSIDAMLEPLLATNAASTLVSSTCEYARLSLSDQSADVPLLSFLESAPNRLRIRFMMALGAINRLGVLPIGPMRTLTQLLEQYAYFETTPLAQRLK